MDETERRRKLQQEYNEAHGITPQSIRKTLFERGMKDQRTIQDFTDGQIQAQFLQLFYLPFPLARISGFGVGSREPPAWNKRRRVLLYCGFEIGDCGPVIALQVTNDSAVANVPER